MDYIPHYKRHSKSDKSSGLFRGWSASGRCGGSRASLQPCPSIRTTRFRPSIDPNGPGGQPLALFESGAILIYLADKSGQFMPQDAAGRYETIQWLMWQIGGIGPMFGHLGFFHKFAGKDYDDKRPRDRYVEESKRLLGVLNQRLADRAWIMGDDFTIVDIATFPWVRNLIGFYGAGELVEIARFSNVTRVLAAFVARPAVDKGLNIPKRV